MHFVKKAKTSLIGGVAIFSPQFTFKIQQGFFDVVFICVLARIYLEIETYFTVGIFATKMAEDEATNISENEIFEEEKISTGFFAKKGWRMRLQMHFVKKAETSLIGGVTIFYPQFTFKIQQRFFHFVFIFVLARTYLEIETSLLGYLPTERQKMRPQMILRNEIFEEHFFSSTGLMLSSSVYWQEYIWR